MNQILDKISKTLELSTNNTNVNEAQTAMLAAQRLMAKYHISQEEIDDFINQNEKDKNEEVVAENTDNEINNDKWKRKLMVMIAKNFRCDVYYHGSKLRLVGTKEDIAISKRIYLYAKQVILKGFKEYAKIHYDFELTDNTVRNKYKREYALGFINGLYEKFEEQKAKSELSLVVVNPDVKEFLSNIHFAGIHHERKSYITDSNCFQTGKKNGKNLADIDTRMDGVN